MASYYVYSGATGSANGTSWANAYTTVAGAMGGKAAGDTYYVAHDHSESTAATFTMGSSGTVLLPTKVICVNRAGSVPPVSADRRATAQIANTGANNITLSGCTHYDGIIFSVGSGAVSAFLIIQNAGLVTRFDNCSLRIAATGTGCRIGPSVGSSYVELNNTTLSFANASQGYSPTGVTRWRNTPSALLGTIPTALFTPGAVGGFLECFGVDLSAAGSGKTICSTLSTAEAVTLRFVDCKLDAAVTKSTVPVGHGANEVDFLRSGASGNYNVFRHRVSGTLDQETTIVRTGGATDGTTPISWKVTTTANCNYSSPFECPPVAIWNDTTGSAKIATIECIASAVMKDDECWLELEYLGDASSPQGSFISDGKTDVLATGANQTTSSATWGGSTAAFKLNVTFTAQQKGWAYARVKVGKASSTVYIDPLVTLT